MEDCPFKMMSIKGIIRDENNVLEVENFELTKKILNSDLFRTPHINEFDNDTNSFFLALSISNEKELERLKKNFINYFTKTKINYLSDEFFKPIIKHVTTELNIKKRSRLDEFLIFGIKEIVYKILGISKKQGEELVTGILLAKDLSDKDPEQSSHIYQYIFYEIRKLMIEQEKDTQDQFIRYLKYNSDLSISEKITFVYPFLEMASLGFTAELPLSIIVNLEKKPELKYDLINNLVSFNDVFDEAARYLNNVTLTRFAEQDIQLDDYTFLKGDKIRIPISKVNKNSDMFTDPQVFNPHRDNLYQSLAFGLGSHKCLGKDLMKEISKIFCTELLALDYKINFLDNDVYEVEVSNSE